MKSVFNTLVALSVSCLLVACGTVLQKESTGNGNAPTPIATQASGGFSSLEKPLESELKSPPRFQDYVVTDGFSGSTPQLKFSARTEKFRSQFTSAAKQTPNFAGHFILTNWGCGTDCQMGGVIDAKTGETYVIPFTVCCGFETNEDAEMMDFRADSSLIILNGLLNEDENAGSQHFYTFENGGFVSITSGAPGNWQCHNDLEIGCKAGRCAATEEGAFTPMSVALSESGSISVCAYSGCWEGNARVESSNEFLVWIATDLEFSTAPDSLGSRESILVAMDKTDRVGTLKAGGFALPLLCEPSESP